MTELEHVRNIFKDLGYALDIVDFTITKTKHKFDCLKYEPNKCPVYLKLPYNWNEVVQQNLKKLVENSYTAMNLLIVFKFIKVFKIDNKDKLPTHNNINLIYKYACFSKQTYVAQWAENCAWEEHAPV